jgi:hypothetical protein
MRTAAWLHSSILHVRQPGAFLHFGALRPLGTQLSGHREAGSAGPQVPVQRQGASDGAGLELDGLRSQDV